MLSRKVDSHAETAKLGTEALCAHYMYCAATPSRVAKTPLEGLILWISNAVAVPECNQLLAIRPVLWPRTPSPVVRPSARGLRTQYSRDTPSIFPGTLILYCLEAAFLAAAPLSLGSGEGLTGL